MHPSIRLLAPLFLFLAFHFDRAAASGPPARFEIHPRDGRVAIVWGRTPRPAPMPPIERSALLVPVTLEGLERTFYFQFDLGHPSTVLHSAKWKDIAARLGRPAGSPPTDLRLRVGEMEVRASGIGVLDTRGAGIAWESDQPEVIGTLGSDFVDERVVLLDFAGNTLTLASSRDRLAEPGAKFQPFRFKGRRLLLPARFEGRDIHLMYDSGSSAFSWLTDRESAERLSRKGASPMVYPVRSWSKTLTAHTYPSDATVTIGGVTLPVRDVSHVEGMNWMQQVAVRALGLDGMVGNALFVGRRVLIDVPKREFAILG